MFQEMIRKRVIICNVRINFDYKVKLAAGVAGAWNLEKEKGGDSKT